ncbi:MAG: hypothetical protein ACRDLO_06980 [Solirubrobacterales bacterium]
MALDVLALTYRRAATSSLLSPAATSGQHLALTVAELGELFR